MKNEEKGKNITIENRKRFEIWIGNNKFLCNGKIYAG